MPSIKITELPNLAALSANNANTVFVVVDKTTNTTSQFSTTVLAQGLYANNILNVGTSNTGLLLPNSVAQFISNTAIFSQVNFQNLSEKGSADIVITSDDGDNSNNYLDLGVQGSNMDADPTFDLPNNDGYLYMHGTDGQKQGNLWIGTAVANTDLVFFTGAHKQANEVARIEDGVGLSLKMPIKFADGTTQNTAAGNITSINANTIITQGVDATQNTRLNSIETINTNQNTSISIIEGVNLTQNTNITQVNQFAQSAYNKANTALANTDGVFTAGSFNVSGNLTANGTLVLANSNFSPTEAAVTISATAGVATPSNDGYMLHISGKQNVASRIVADSYGANTYVVFAGRSSRGTRLAPQAVANGDVLMRISGNGYGTTGYAPIGVGRIDIVATENHTDSNRGTRIEMWNMPIGSNTLNRIASFNGESVEFSGVINPQKGFVYAANTYPSSQTAITISFADGPVYRAQTSAGLAVTLTNFTVGKAVEFWLTNTAGTGQTFTHGCSAINSTVNSTTYNIPATSTIYAKYYCLDGTLANTFVAITHP